MRDMHGLAATGSMRMRQQRHAGSPAGNRPRLVPEAVAAQVGQPAFTLPFIEEWNRHL